MFENLKESEWSSRPWEAFFFPLPTIVSPVRRKKNRTDFFLFAFGRKVFVIFAIKLRKDSIEFTLLFLKA